MKKILLTAIVALFAVTAASAQDKGNWALGPRMNIYTNTGDAVVGLGAFGRYSFTDNWRIEPSLTALLPMTCKVSHSFSPLAGRVSSTPKFQGFKYSSSVSRSFKYSGWEWKVFTILLLSFTRTIPQP